MTLGSIINLLSVLRFLLYELGLFIKFCGPHQMLISGGVHASGHLQVTCHMLIIASEYERKSYSCLLNFCKSGVNFLVWFGSRKLSHTTLIKGWRLRPVAVTFHHRKHFFKSFFIFPSTLITSTFSWPFTVKLWTEVLILYLMWNSESFLRLLWIIWWHLVKLNIDITSLSQHWSAYLLLELLGNESFRPGSSYLQLLLAVCWLI